MNIVLIGAGYVGTALLSALQGSGHDLYVTTTQSQKVSALQPFAKEVLLLNAQSENKYEEWILSADAILVLVAPGKSGSYRECYLNTAQKIASILCKRSKAVHLIYTSSTSVCESNHEEWISEETPLFPQSENGKILLETEECYLHAEADACVLRLGGIFGPHRTIANRAKFFSGKTLPGTGNEPTNHIHLNDIVRAIIFCLDHRLTGLFHLVNDDHPTRKQLYGHLCKELQLPPPQWDGSILPKGGYKILNEKIKKAGFVFEYPRAVDCL